MEVHRLVLVLSILSIASVACEKRKTLDDVMSSKNTQTSGLCPARNLIKNQFLVKYEDGRVELIHAENEAVFEKHFVEPRLNEIKRVEYNAKVTLYDRIETESSPGRDVVDQGPALIHSDAAWSQGFYGQGVAVAVVDTAIDYTHPQLAPRLLVNSLEDKGGIDIDDDMNGYVDDRIGWDFISDSPPRPITSPDVEHGSHVAGIILADPTKGSMSGVAPQASLIPASFIDPENGDIAAGIAAIQYSASRGAKIINASWGGTECSDTLKEAIAELTEQGILFVTASGNDGIDFDIAQFYSFPAAFNLQNQITVAATDLLDGFAAFSNRSFSLVHIGAPGVGVRSTVPQATSQTGYQLLSGTSMAAPFVSGAAALLWSAKPNATVAQIKQALLQSADERSYKVSTQGRLNIEKALEEIRRIVP